MTDTPVIIIRVALEAEPVACVVAMSDGASCRLGHWADRRRAELHAAVDQAIEAALAGCDLRRAA